MMSNERFCPEWLFKIIISQSVYDYIVRDVALFISARKFLTFFSKHYDELKTEEIEAGAIAFIEFLGEVKAKDPFLLLNHFVYSIISDVKPNEKGLFKKKLLISSSLLIFLVILAFLSYNYFLGKNFLK